MNKNYSHESIPIGKASDLETHKEVLPATEVKNKVRWVNNEIDLPLKLDVGIPTNIGLFLTLEQTEETKSLEVMPKHGRSALLGRAIFSDKQHSLFREIDLKGCGKILKNELYPEKRSLLRVGPVEITKDALRERTQGVVDLKDAERDRDVSEYFYKNGVRVPRVAALIELEEIIDKHGNKIAVDEAKRRGLIQRDAEVGLEVRVFVTKARVSDSDDDNWNLLLNDARSLVAQELGKNESQFTEHDYILWFAKTLGRNVGRMNSLGYSHGFLTRQNITLDCRIVDFDSAQRFENVPEKRRNMMESTIQKIIGYKPNISDIKELAAIHDYVLAYSTLDNFLQTLGFTKRGDSEVLKKLSSASEEGYIEGGGQKLPAL